MAPTRPRVALVFPAHRHPHSFFGYLLPPLGLERLAAAIEDLAEVAVYDARFEPDLIAEVARFRPDVIGVSVKSTMHAHESYAAADALRAALPAATVVMGGLHATSMPEEALEHADFVVCGEGETPFRELVAGDAPEGIRGLAFMGPGGLVHNPLAPPKADLDGLRPPATCGRPWCMTGSRARCRRSSPKNGA